MKKNKNSKEIYFINSKNTQQKYHLFLNYRGNIYITLFIKYIKENKYDMWFLHSF